MKQAFAWLILYFYLSVPTFAGYSNLFKDIDLRVYDVAPVEVQVWTWTLYDYSPYLIDINKNLFEIKFLLLFIFIFIWFMITYILFNDLLWKK